jgi:uncharacterized protein YvpB
MIFDYMNRLVLTKPEQDLSEDEIAKIMKTMISGTHFHNIESINKVLTTSNPSLEFVAEFEPHTLNDIRKELESGLPVSVWIITNDGSNDYVHSIVITGIDEVKKEICYNDPTYGRERTISQIEFMSLWESHGARMIKTKIGGINRDTLEKYMPSGVEQ